MTDVASGSAAMRPVSDDHVHVGWRFAQAYPDPGPPPAEPATAEDGEAPRSSPITRYPGDNLLTRPLKVAAAGTCVGVLIIVAAWLFDILPGPFALGGLLACALIFAITGYSIWQGEQIVRARSRDERARLERDRRARQRRVDRARQEHTIAHRDWELRRAAYERQREWHPVVVPPGVDRVDVAGGTLAGWSAAVTMMGAARLAAGSQVTVVDLSEGAVAADLVRLAAGHGEDPLVWVLPDDLPRLDLTRNLGPAAFADVLSLVVGAGEEKAGNRDLSVDNSILERVLAELGGSATIPQVTAALRALAQVGDPRDDLRRGLLSEGQLDRILMMFGRGAADKVVIGRAWALESQLRKLEPLGSDPVPLPPAGLRVISLDRRNGVLANRVLGTYVTTALTHSLRADPAGGRWGHTLFLCGAEKLRGDVLDRLTDACESAGTGLVLLYRTIPKAVRQRLGRGHAAVGFMRLGNAEDARVAAQHIGTGQRLVVSGVTEAAGEHLAGLECAPYASTVAYARRGERPLTDPIRVPVHRPHPAGSALVEGVASDPTWAGSVTVHSGTGPRRRFHEVAVEQDQLQRLPPTAMVFTHATDSGRRIQLVDANPGIMALPAAQGPAHPEPPPSAQGPPWSLHPPSGPESAAQDHPDDLQADPEQVGRDQSDRDQSDRDQSDRDQFGRDQSGRDQSGRDQSDRDQFGRDQFGPPSLGQAVPSPWGEAAAWSSDRTTAPSPGQAVPPHPDRGGRPFSGPVAAPLPDESAPSAPGEAEAHSGQGVAPPSSIADPPAPAPPSSGYGRRPAERGAAELEPGTLRPGSGGPDQDNGSAAARRDVLPRHAAPRGMSPRTPQSAPPLRPGGRHSKPY